MQQSNEQTLKQVIEDFIDSLQMRERYDQAKLLQNWEEIMGKTISKYTSDIYIRNGKLFLYVTSSPLKQELFIMREKIAERANEALGRDVIKEVIVK